MELLSTYIDSLFQFTHPGRGATPTIGLLRLDDAVSIHAPREGCDCLAMVLRLRSTRFNSRTPGGVRPQSPALCFASTQFQFTHPGRGATALSRFRRFISLMFQFTHPGRGATSTLFKFQRLMSFQFTHPGRGATVAISLRHKDTQFQFTHPGRGATIENGKSYSEYLVSIHAPREGCDVGADVAQAYNELFQFTHPGRGATGVARRGL